MSIKINKLMTKLVINKRLELLLLMNKVKNINIHKILLSYIDNIIGVILLHLKEMLSVIG